MADIHKTTLQNIENTQYSVKFDILISIAKVLEIPIGKLTDFKHES